jgi:hypothetical protein
MQRRRALLLLLLMGAAAAPASAAERWLHATTTHFELLGNVGEGELRRVALKFEQFRAALDEVLVKGEEPAGGPERARPLVFVFKDRKSFKPYLPLVDGKAVQLGGYFQPGYGRHYITVMVERGPEDPYHVVFHEYVHLLTSGDGSQPSWFREGIAEFHSGNDLDSRPVKLGVPMREHVFTMRERRPLPMEAFLTMTQPPPHDREGMRVFYAQAWIFVHYLMAERENGRAQLKEFLGRLGAGQELRASFTKAFAVDPAAMEKELRRYAQGRGFRYFPVQVSGAYQKQVTIRPLAPVEAESRLAELAAQMPERHAEGRARLQKLVEQNPQLAVAREALAALDRGRMAWSVHAVVAEAPAGATPLEPPGGTMSGQLAALSKRVSDLVAASAAESPSPAVVAELDTALRAFMESHPQLSDGPLMLLRVRETLGAPLPERLELAEKALAADGDSVNARVYIANVKRRLLDLEGARRMLNEGLQRTSDPARRLLLTRELEHIQDLREVKGALVELRCGAGGALDFVVEEAGQRRILHAESPDSFTVARDGEQVLADLTCGRQRRTVAALYRVSGTSAPGMDGELFTISLPDK